MSFINIPLDSIFTRIIPKSSNGESKLNNSDFLNSLSPVMAFIYGLLTNYFSFTKHNNGNRYLWNTFIVIELLRLKNIIKMTEEF
jgi:hypothetical protein